MATYNLKQSTDYTAFDSNVTTNDILTYRAKGGVNPGSGWIALIVILACLSAIFFIGFIVKLIGSIIDGYFGDSAISEMIDILVPSIFFALLIFPIYFLNKSAARRAMVQLIRIKRFAEANGWEYEHKADDLNFAGMLFKEGKERQTYDVIHSDSGIEFTIGTHNYVTGTGRGRSNNEWGFVVLPVKTNISHVILDAKANNGKVFNKELFSNLPQVFDKNRKITISPEVSETYDVYAPEGEQAAVAQIITNEFVAKMKQLSRPYDLEIIGGKAYVYNPNPFNKTQQEYAEIMQLIDILSEAFSVSSRPIGDKPVLVDESDITEQVLKGRTPTYVKVLGVVGVIIQFIALTILIISSNNQ